MSRSPGIGSVLWSETTDGEWRWGRDRDHARLIAVPSSAEMRQAIPWRVSSVVATGRRASDDRTRSRQLRDSVGAAGLLMVGATSRSRRLRVARSGSLVDQIATTLGMPAAAGIVLCGPPRANQKPVIQLHDRHGRTMAYVKVAWNDLTRRLLDAEATSLLRLAATDLDGFVVPPVLDRGTFRTATWLALGPLSVDRRRASTLGGVDRVALAIESTAPSWEGPAAASPYLVALRAKASGLTAGEPAMLGVAERWGACETVLRAGHGDYVPWNMLTGHTIAAVWDWERYDQAVPAGFDRLHYRLQVRVHRSRTTVTQAVAAIEADLATVLPELAPEQRHAHLDWYLVDLLCRYERDALDHPTPRLLELIGQLNDVLKGRQAST